MSRNIEIVSCFNIGVRASAPVLVQARTPAHQHGQTVFQHSRIPTFQVEATIGKPTARAAPRTNERVTF
jgi:hypothetical protein